MTKRRTYTKQFKQEAVRLAEEQGYAQTGRQLGVNRTLLGKWKNKLDQHGEQAFPGQGTPRDEELAHLRRELSRVQEENAILKKAVGIFSKSPR